MRYRSFGGLRLPVWSTFTTEGLIPKLEALFQEGMRLASRVSAKKHPTYEDVITRFEDIDERIWRVVCPLFFLCDTDAAPYADIESVKNTVEVMLIRYYVGIYLRRGLARAAKAVESSKDFKRRSKEEQYILSRLTVTLDETGVNLPRHQKRRLRELLMKQVEVENKFQQNVVAATDSWTLDVVDEKQLRGVPREVLLAARDRAMKAGKDGLSVSLKRDDYMSVMEFAEDRVIRKKMWHAYNTRASKLGPDGGAFDNSSLMCAILKFRDEYAKLLGYNDYASQNIGFMMADKVHIVDRFLDRLSAATKKKSKREDTALRKFAKQKLGMQRLGPWDVSFVMRKMCEAKYGIDDETIRAYFPLESVLSGLSRLTKRLYAGCTLVEVTVPTWHPSVRFFEVRDVKGKTLGGFYLDPFARKGKANGAWAYSVMVRYQQHGRTQHPAVAISLNLRSPQAGDDATLTHEDLLTLFHEFGHTLHLIFGRTKHRDSMAFFLEWDAVELPSQFMEQWAWKKDVLSDLSGHKVTGDPIPEVILDALIASRHFEAGSEYGFRMTRALFDWRIHKSIPKSETELMKIYREAALATIARPLHPSFRGPHTFTHIFSGGYGAGYYGYLWSDSLVADLLAAFRRAGKRKEAMVARKYRKEILSTGSARLFAVSFKAFRGRGHRTRFVLRHLGLIK